MQKSPLRKVLTVSKDDESIYLKAYRTENIRNI